MVSDEQGQRRDQYSIAQGLQQIGGGHHRTLTGDDFPSEMLGPAAATRLLDVQP